jgi:hypothetical protein
MVCIYAPDALCPLNPYKPLTTTEQPLLRQARDYAKRALPELFDVVSDDAPATPASQPTAAASAAAPAADDAADDDCD